MRRDNLKVGDPVVVWSNKSELIMLRKVERITKTTVTIAGQRFSIASGRSFGSTPRSSLFFESYVPERHNRELERSRMARRIAAAKQLLDKLDVVEANIDRIEAFIKEITS